MEQNTRPRRPTMDEKDRLITQCILRYPQASIEAIAEETKIAASTVQKRLADMLTREQLARVIEVRDWASAQFPVRYRIDVKVRQTALMEKEGGGPIPQPQGGEVSEPEDDLDEIPFRLPQPARRITSQKKLGRYIRNRLARAEDFKNRLVCLDVVILMGQAYDLSITVRAKDSDAVTDFVTRGLRFLRSVDQTMSSLEAWSCADEERRAMQIPRGFQHISEI